MLTDEAIDEDIEALLYAQVYYGKPEHSEAAENKEIDLSLQKESLIEGINSEFHKPNVFSENNSFDKNNLNLEEKKNEDSEVNLEPSIISDRSKSPPRSASKGSTENLEKPQDPNFLSKSQDHGPPTRPQQQYIEISTTSASTQPNEKKSAQVVTQIPLLTAPSNSSSQQLLNSITINQYICPGDDFLSRLQEYRKNIVWSKQCEKDLKRVQKGKLDEEDFFKSLKQKLNSQKNKLRKQEQIRRAFFRKLQKIASSEVICLSDTDNSDVEIVSVECLPKSMQRKKVVDVKPKVVTSTEVASVEDSNDDDEIIYIAPPPVPLINVEDESGDDEGCSKELHKKPLQDLEEASNDFLAPTNTTESFNFSLHGSEFQDAEFVRPANPTDTYETESSTSTSDFNRDSSREFSNSVKTIVFNEVDFPREDIFEESNLEKFGELITPNRGIKPSEDADKNKSSNRNLKGLKKVNPRTSSESSSESDYSEDTHRNLPALSPMVNPKLSPTKKTKTKFAENNKEISTRSNKRDKPSHFSEENHGIFDVQESEITDEAPIIRKLKRQSSGVVSENDVPKKKAKKKKKKSAGNSADDLEDPTKDSNTSKDETNTNSATKKMKSNCTSRTPSDDISDIIDDQLDTSKKKSKKKKKQTRIIVEEKDDTSLIEQDSSAIAENSSKKKSKRKKGSRRPADQDDILRITSENIIKSLIQEEKNIPEDSSKKKANKRKQRVSSSIPDSVPEGSSTVANDPEVASIQHKNKRKKQSSSDKKSSVENVENLKKSKNSEINQSGKDALEEIIDSEQAYMARAGEEVVVEKQEDEDVMIIEQAIPVHTIESSESDDDDDDILSLDDLNVDLELANITGSADNIGGNGDDLTNNKITTDTFDVEQLQSKMSDDPEKWKILPVDRYNIVSLGKRGPKCHKCREVGHIAIQCPNKPSLPTCSLCGYEGHQEPRCPNKVCFTCAKPGNYSTVFCYKCARERNQRCRLCHLQGHSTNHCPDRWRRYYLTTREGPLVQHKSGTNPVKPRSQQWCSGCAGKGHLEYECQSTRWIREYPSSVPHIVKYGDVYESRKKREEQSNLQDKLDQQRSQSHKQIDVSRQKVTVNNSQPIIDKEIGGSAEEAQPPLTSQTEQLQPASGTPQETKPRESLESPNFEPPKPENENGVSHNIEPSGNTESKNQDQRTHRQLAPPSEALYIPTPPQKTYNLRSRQKCRKERLNPLSLLPRQGFTPYQSVLNPYAVRGTQSANDLSGSDIGGLFIDNVGVPSLNDVQSGSLPFRLFNSISNDVLAQQISNLVSYSGYEQTNLGSSYDSSGYHQMNQRGTYDSLGYQQVDQGIRYDFSQDHGFQGYQNDNIQIPHNPTSCYERPSNNYLDFSDPLPDERYLRDEQYFDFVSPRRDYNRDFLNVPYTITREPSREQTYQNRDVQVRQSDRVNKQNATAEEKVNNRPDGFISLTDQQQTYKTMKMRNVNEDTVNKFKTSSIKDLHGFLNSEIEKLDNVRINDGKVYKKKLNNIDQLKKIDVKTNAVKKQMYFLYKHINMFLFGTQRLADGKKHLDFLRNFVYTPGRNLHDGKRCALLEAYGYIFGGEHQDFNYRRHLNALSIVQKP